MKKSSPKRGAPLSRSRGKKRRDAGGIALALRRISGRYYDKEAA